MVIATCSDRVFARDGRDYHGHPCTNKAKVQRQTRHDGLKWFCGVHDPERPKTKAQLKADERQNRRREHNRRISACLKACQEIPTEALEAGLVRELVDLVRMCIENKYDGLDVVTEIDMENRMEQALAKLQPEGIYAKP